MHDSNNDDLWQGTLRRLRRWPWHCHWMHYLYMNGRPAKNEFDHNLRVKRKLWAAGFKWQFNCTQHVRFECACLWDPHLVLILNSTRDLRLSCVWLSFCILWWSTPRIDIGLNVRNAATPLYKIVRTSISTRHKNSAVDWRRRKDPAKSATTSADHHRRRWQIRSATWSPCQWPRRMCDNSRHMVFAIASLI